MFNIKVVVSLVLVDEAGELEEVLFYPLKEARKLLRKEGGNSKDSRFT